MIKIDLGAVNAELERFSPELIVQWTLELFGRNIIMSSSFGEQSAVMIHMLTSVWPDIPVVVTDTGYFFPETYAFMETLRRRFEINLRIYKSPMTPAEMESEHGKLWEQGADGMAEYNSDS